jgi:HD-GYP domain-containing protein (c-di-GMP phosphodiesterase class II)
VAKRTADANRMRLFLRERFAPLLVLVGAGAILPAAGLSLWGHRMVMLGTQWHFTGVGVSALAAALAALALTVVGIRRNDGRVILLSTAFTVMAALLAIHGLATPGVIVGYNGVISLTGAATLPAGAAILALSALPPLRRPHSIKGLLWLEAGALVAVVGLGVIGLGFPAVVPDVPAPGSGGAITALVVGMSLFAILILRALKTYLLTRRNVDLAVVLGVAWLMAAIPPATLMTFMDLGWWLGHALELAGIVIVSVTVAIDLHRAAQSRSLVGDFSAAELVAEEEAFLGTQVHALLQRLAEKDESTEEHTRRVALRAVQVGEEMALAPGRLRALAIGGLLHDMGKLSVPERILKKPSSLEDDEFAVIKRHPEWGLKLLRELGGFPAGVLDLVHSHHERLDGKGYPRGLAECDLSLDTRIMTVCDVYDALVSPRVYRDAWSHEAAIGLLRDQTGTAFDQRCVAALEAVLGREQPQPSLATLRIAAASA